MKGEFFKSYSVIRLVKTRVSCPFWEMFWPSFTFSFYQDWLLLFLLAFNRFCLLSIAFECFCLVCIAVAFISSLINFRCFCLLLLAFTWFCFQLLAFICLLLFAFCPAFVCNCPLINLYCLLWCVIVPGVSLDYVRECPFDKNVFGRRVTQLWARWGGRPHPRPRHLDNVQITVPLSSR